MTVIHWWSCIHHFCPGCTGQMDPDHLSPVRDTSVHAAARGTNKSLALWKKDSVSWIGHPHKNSSWAPSILPHFLIKSGRKSAALFTTWRCCNGNLKSIQKGKHPSQMWGKKPLLVILLLLYFSCLYFSTIFFCTESFTRDMLRSWWKYSSFVKIIITIKMQVYY